MTELAMLNKYPRELASYLEKITEKTHNIALDFILCQ